MGIGLLFWIIYIVWVIFGFTANGSAVANPPNYWRYGRHIVLVILIGLLGWHVFGAAVHS